MALIYCPECNHQVSDTAETCPNCGFDLKNKQPFEVVSNPLSDAFYNKNKAKGELIGGICCITCGIPLVPFIIGVFFILVGIWCLIKYSGIKNTKLRKGKCPYCNTELIVPWTSNAFTCPICHNTGNQTDTALVSTHKANKSQQEVT